ncbi:hypothetical protein [Marispirochaeta aestuarii]|uniref:hypothetical protein n=1 Tax=Marispirochaeta aestuarii TaxID=1963862 RepID=UPI002ABDF325|nr:hypothetical protein [Marispirochaeta aestuarii]
MVTTGFFEREPGHKSMIRLLAFMGMLLGTLVTIWGMVLLTLMILAVLNGETAPLQAVGSMVLLVSAGLGLAAGGEALKTIQAKIEKKVGV